MNHHHTITTHGIILRSLRPLLRFCTLLAATLLGGCAALQIDVDVYKGPLVHDEDTQVQQLASIAMSGKSVMLLQRNSRLDKLRREWSTHAPKTAKGVRSRHLRAEEWNDLGFRETCEDAFDTGYGMCRQARLINDMLSAYEDRVEPGLAEPMETVGQRYRVYTTARSRYASALKKTAADKAKPATTAAQSLANDLKSAAALADADDGLRQTWGAVVDLLYEAKRRMPATEDSAFRAIERQAAEILAQLTDPGYLLCAAAALPPGVELARVLQPMTDALKTNHNTAAQQAGAQRAVRLFNGALRLARAEEIYHLRNAVTVSIPLTDGRCQVSQAEGAAALAPRYPSKQEQTTPAVGSPDAAAGNAPGRGLVIVRKGVHREATGNQDQQDALDDDLREIEELWGALMQLGASGFDRGRPLLGLDRLADAASDKRFKDRDRGSDKLDALADADQTKQLHDSVVDLASRMQFLAVNLQLVDSSSTGTDQAFKSTLESIANTLLVLAEDQRRQREHRQRQKVLANDEKAAAVATFQTAGAKPDLSAENRDSALSTLERVEAYLNYRRIDALQRGAPVGTTTNTVAQDADYALAALMQRRERMSYIRPASMYLRSALATTAQQADPALEWSNLLTATFKRLIRGETENSKAAAAVRADLDKSFWQNVNQVRVSAGGTSNFAIAKDDVGNWYVKAMGSDPAKMVAAAKNLALYNLGGRVDTNFLRVDELRNKQQRSAQDNEEMESLLDRKNGASATAYGNTLQVFEANHAKTVKALLTSVQDDLKLKALHTALQARWAATYADSTPRLAAVNGTLDAAPVLSLHDKALSAADNGMAGTAGASPSSALIDTLALLAQQRSLLKTQLTGLALLTASELTAVNEQQALAEKKASALATSQDQRQKLADELLSLRKELVNASAPAKPGLQTQVDEQQNQLNAAGDQIGRQHIEWIEAQKSSKAAATALATARGLHARALEDVDAVWHRYVKDVAARQLRAVEEMETAARVVSQGVQGKPASP